MNEYLAGMKKRLASIDDDGSQLVAKKAFEQIEKAAKILDEAGYHEDARMVGALIRLNAPMNHLTEKTTLEV